MVLKQHLIIKMHIQEIGMMKIHIKGIVMLSQCNFISILILLGYLTLKVYMFIFINNKQDLILIAIGKTIMFQD